MFELYVITQTPDDIEFHIIIMSILLVILITVSMSQQGPPGLLQNYEHTAKALAQIYARKTITVCKTAV